MSAILAVLLVVAVGVIAFLMLSGRSKIAAPGEGKYDAHGQTVTDRRSPPDVDPLSQAAQFVGGIIGAAFAAANNAPKSGSTSAAANTGGSTVGGVSPGDEGIFSWGAYAN